LNEKGQAATRITFSEDGYIKIKTGYREGNLLEYKPDVKYNFTIHYNTATRSYEISVNDKKEATRLFFQPVKQINRVAFRTGSVRTYPDANTPTDQNFDVENPGVSTNNSNYQIHYFKAKSIK
ncbi:MAG TPA: six-hairpin glycosidase, partial [Candidatus Sphingobacterium stercoripullorum]|nr:six-hairpin glycosidase [Candidatus Sphingobacterium stercoripullorum]